MKPEHKRDLGTWASLVDLAIEDGHITIDESKLLKIILDNASIYREVLEQAFDDGELSKDDRERLIEQRQKILDEASEIANEDEIITKDELAILKKTGQIIKQLEKNEYNFSQYWS